MSEHEFDVRFRVFREESKAAHAAEDAAYRRHTRLADRTAKEVEASAKREADARKRATAEVLTDEQAAEKAREELIRRENAALIRSLANAQDERKRTAELSVGLQKEAAEAARKAAREQTAVARKEAADKADIAKVARDAQVEADRATRTARAELAKANRQYAKEAAEQAKAEARVKKEAMKSQAAAAKELQEAQAGASKSHVSGLTEGLGAVTSLVAGYGALQIATKVVGAIAAMWAAQRKDIEDSVDRLAKYREGMLELASLKDRLGQTTPELKSQLNFRAKTLQTRGEAQVFQGGVMDTGQASVMAGFIKQEELDKLAVKAGSYQVAAQAEPEAFGKLSGMMPTLIGKKDQKAEDVYRRQVGIANILKLGVGGLKSGVAQFSANSGLTKLGLFDSPEQQASLQSFFSLTNSEAAGTHVNQFVRGTVGALGRTQGGKLEGHESQGAYLRGLGATNQQNPLQIGRLIAADFKKQEKANARTGKKFNPLDYLTMHGYRDEEARLAVMDFAAGINSGQFDATFGAMAEGKAIPTLAEADFGVRRFQQGPDADARRAPLATDLADTAKAAGPEGFYLDLKKRAFERMRARGDTYGTFEETNDSKTWRGALLDEAQDLLVEGASKVGIASPEGTDDPQRVGHVKAVGIHAGPLGGSPHSRIFYSEADRAKYAYEYATRIRAAGGDVSGMDELLGRAGASLDAAGASEDRAARGLGPPPKARPPEPAAAPAAPDGPGKTVAVLEQIRDRIAPAPVQVARPGGVNAGLTR